MPTRSLLLFLLSAPFIAQAQCLEGGMEWVNPLPQGWNLYDVHSFGGERAVAVGMSGTLISSTDGGDPWSKTHCAGNDDDLLYALDFPSDSTGWAVGDSGTVLQTTDGGTNWTPQSNPVPANEHLRDVRFIDEDSGWAVGSNGIVIRTFDGGGTWSMSNTPTSEILHSVEAVGGSKVWAGSGSGTLIHTSDGGASWTSQGNGVGGNDLHFLNDSTGWSAPGANHLYRTNDGGDSWQQVPTPSTTGIDHVRFLNDSVGWINDGNSFFVSTDGGNSWTDKGINLYGYMEGVHFSNKDTGWAVGSRGQVYRTTSGWDQRDRIWKGDFEGWLNGVDPVSAQKAWAVGRWGRIASFSLDSGIMNYISTNTNEAFLSVHFANENIGCAVGDNGEVRCTDDGGNNWQSRFFSGYPLYDVFFSSSSHAWAVGYEGVYHSNDGGNSWVQQSPSNQFTYRSSVDFVNDSIGCVVGGSGMVLRTENGGNGWTDKGGGISQTLHSVELLKPSVAYAVGDSGTILHTETGWDDHTVQNSPVTEDLVSVAFIDRNTGWVVGDQGSILFTHNGGQDWAIKSKNAYPELNDVALFKQPGRLWVAGKHQSLLVDKTLHTSTKVKKNPEQSGWTVYPNPAQNRIKVKGGPFQREEIRFTLLSSRGQVIRSKKIAPGNKEEGLLFSMTVSDLARGLYFLKMEGEEQVKKIMVDPGLRR